MTQDRKLLSSDVLKVGMEENTYPGCSNALHKMFVCEDIFARSIGHWLKLLWNGSIELITYPTIDDGGFNLDLLTDLMNGTIDVSPMETVVLPEYVDNFTFLTTLSSAPYEFYTMLPRSAENGIEFLLSPFEKSLWIFVLITTLFVGCYFLWFKRSKTCRNFPHYDYISKSFQLLFALGAFVGCIYDSRLCALLSTRNSDIPIKSLPDLIQKIQNGRMKIYLEGTNLWRWYLLNSDVEKHENMKILSKVINETDSLIIQRNLTALCEHVSTNADAVYFSYEDLIQIECSQFCFWKYKIDEIPVLPASFLMSKNSKFIETGNIYAHAILTYRMNTMKMRRSVAPCYNEKDKLQFIGQQSLLVPIFFYAVITALAFGILFLEVLLGNYLRRKRKYLYFLGKVKELKHF